MTDDPKPPPPPDPDGLQFDRAEPLITESGDACAGCRQRLAGVYFLAGTQRICTACRDSVEQSLASGSKGGRVFKATGLGLLAALASGAAWAFIIIQFDMIIGLLAIGLGLFVGMAVRKGSEGRGGRGYQILAVALTYLGVAVGYSGAMIPAALKANPSAVRQNPPAEEKPSTPSEATPAAAAPSEEPSPSLGGCVLGLSVLVGLGLASPILMAKESFISVLILGFALWEAWKLNRGGARRLTGPYRIGPAPSENKAGG